MRNKVKSLIKHKIFYAVLLVLTLVLGTRCQKKMTVQDYLDLGEKYLTEANYEEAAVAFTKAIELEPREIGAYEKLAGAYTAQGNTEQALENLNKAVSVYEGLSEEEQTEERKAAYERIQAAANTLSVKMTLEAEYMDLLKQLKEKMTSDAENFGNSDFGSKLLLGKEFNSLTENLTEPLMWQQEDGTWIAVYPGGYIYVGEMEDGKRSGNGAWYLEESGRGLSVYLFKGTWKDDYPNGAGTAREYLSYDGGAVEMRQGEYAEGLENGAMTISLAGPGGTDVYQYTATNGIPDQVEMDLDAEETMAVMEHISGPDTNRWHFEDGDYWGVYGALKE